MKYTLAKLHKPKKGNDWYVYYTFQNPEGEMVLFKERRGINRIKNLKDRKKEGLLLATSLNNDLDKGWNPFNPEPPTDKSRQNFFWWFDSKIENELARGDAGYYNWKNLTQARKRLAEFKKEIPLSQFDYKFIKDFEAHLLKKGNDINNIAFIMDKIKAVTQIIIKSGDLAYHKNPFVEYKAKRRTVSSKRITIEDAEKLKDVKLTNKDEDLARDMYIFSFYLAGMRFGDICRVKKSWFKKGKTEYTMNKAKNERSIKIMPEVAKIIKKYSKTPGEYLFDTKVDWENPSKSIDVRNSYYNPKLKKACEAAGIPKISFHTSRHSVADLAHSKNIGISKIKDLLGHSKIATTERYMKRFYKEETDDAMDSIYSKKPKSSKKF